MIKQHKELVDMYLVMILRQALTTICTYPFNIFGIDISFTLKKAFHYVYVASFHCHVQGSCLIERRSKSLNTVSE